jgi:hypothetical protein
MMAIYKLEPTVKKSIEERQHYTKDGLTICYVIGWRWGYYKFQTDEEPNIDLTNNDGIDIYSINGEYVDHTYSDGVYSDWEWPDELSEEQREEILQVYEEDWDDGLYELGWREDDSEVWFFGELELTKEEEA